MGRMLHEIGSRTTLRPARMEACVRQVVAGGVRGARSGVGDRGGGAGVGHLVAVFRVGGFHLLRFPARNEEGEPWQVRGRKQQ